MDVIFYACNRAAAAEALANIPDEEKPSSEELETYVERYRLEASREGDLAWGPQFPQLCAWLSDRNMRKKNKIEKHSFGNTMLRRG